MNIYELGIHSICEIAIDLVFIITVANSLQKLWSGILSETSNVSCN